MQFWAFEKKLKLITGMEIRELPPKLKDAFRFAMPGKWVVNPTLTVVINDRANYRLIVGSTATSPELGVTTSRINILRKRAKEIGLTTAEEEELHRLQGALTSLVEPGAKKTRAKSPEEIAEQEEEQERQRKKQTSLVGKRAVLAYVPESIGWLARDYTAVELHMRRGNGELTPIYVPPSIGTEKILARVQEEIFEKQQAQFSRFFLGKMNGVWLAHLKMADSDVMYPVKDCDIIVDFAPCLDGESMVSWKKRADKTWSRTVFENPQMAERLIKQYARGEYDRDSLLSPAAAEAIRWDRTMRREQSVNIDEEEYDVTGSVLDFLNVDDE